MSARESLRQKRAAMRVPLERCPGCALHLRSCLCDEVQRLDLVTRVIVLRHRKEAHKPTNTGRLVPLTLVNGEVRSFGERGAELRAAEWVGPARRTLLLYPTSDSRSLLRADAEAGPITLIVPDANWRRAHKLATREPALAAFPRVHLPAGPPSIYRLRHHPDPRFLATFEAIARALGILEGPAVQARLERAFRLLVERLLFARGQVASDRVTGGVGRTGPRLRRRERISALPSHSPRSTSRRSEAAEVQASCSTRVE